MRKLAAILAFAGNLAWAFALVPGWLVQQPASTRTEREKRFFGRLLRALGVELTVSGIAQDRPGTMYVANHISFTDIAGLALVLDTRFVAKADMRGWPVLGFLAARFGTIFVDRTRASGARAQADSIKQGLAAGQSLVLFPEGTTSNGAQVLPFRSTLLAAADSAAQVCPIAISYSDGIRRAYIGDESLVANLIRLCGTRTRLDIRVLPPLPPELHRDRKALALAAHAAIVAALGGVRAR